MALRISNRTWLFLALFGFVVGAAALLWPKPTSALPAYGAATGQPCATCHVNPAGGGTLTAKGSAFAAIPTHATDPAGAWAQVSGGAAPAPAPAPSTTGPVSAVLSGVMSDDFVTYAIALSNSSDKDVANIFVSGSIPAGAALVSTGDVPEKAGTPGGGPISVEAALSAQTADSVAWVLDVLPAKTSFGPLLYKVSKGSAGNLSAHAFAHWLAPSEGTTLSDNVAPIDNSTRLGVNQEVNSKLNNIDRTLTLWGIQPGLGTVMIEYDIRFANMWFAAQAGNWDMARYQVAEMTEIQEVGETTRPGRAAALKAFEQAYLEPLDEAAQGGDLAAFTAAYDKATTGCNSCHAAATGLPPEGKAGKFIKITRPAAPVFPNVDWSGQ